MNLSTSVQPPDPQLALPLPAAGTKPAADASDEKHGADFSDLLSDDQEAKKPKDKKPTIEGAGMTAEAAATLLAGWMAPMAPNSSVPVTIGEWKPNLTADGAGPASNSDLLSAEKSANGFAGWMGAGARPLTSAAQAQAASAKAPKVGAVADEAKAIDVSADAAKSGVTAPIAKSGAKNTEVTAGTISSDLSAEEAAPQTVPPAAPAAPGLARSGKTGNRVEMTSQIGREKIAGGLDKSLPLGVFHESSEDKKILSVTGKDVTDKATDFGIPIANSGPVMNSTDSNHPNAASMSLHGVVPTLVDQAVVQVSDVISGSTVASQAHQAVEAVMAAADRMVNSTQTSVQLKFSVGSADLSVRVEMRGGSVHATFRTDSSDLRSALAAEWKSVNTDPSTSRVAEASFGTSTSNFGSSASFSDGAQQQRDSSSRQSNEAFARSSSHFSSFRTGPENTAVDSRPAPSRPDLNLYTFA